MRWALAIGCTVRELLERVTSEEVVEMMAFEMIEPFGGLQDEARAAQICATVANVHRDPKKAPFTAATFSPAVSRALGLDEDGLPVDPAERGAEMLKRMRAASEAMKGKASGRRRVD